MDIIDVHAHIFPEKIREKAVNAKHINDFLHEEIIAHPEFLGFATLHPDLEDIEDEVDRVISMGFTGIKLHADFQQFAIDSDKAQYMYRIIDGRLPILFHMGDYRYSFTNPEKLLKLTKLFPNQIFWEKQAYI